MSTTLTSVLCVRTTHTSSPHTINYNSTIASYPTSVCVYFISVCTVHCLENRFYFWERCFYELCYATVHVASIPGRTVKEATVHV